MRHRAGGISLAVDPESPASLTPATWSWDPTDDGNGSGDYPRKVPSPKHGEGLSCTGGAAQVVSAVIVTFLVTAFAGGIRERTVCGKSRFCPQSLRCDRPNAHRGSTQQGLDSCRAATETLQKKYDAKEVQFDKCVTNLQETIKALKTAKQKSEVDKQLFSAGIARETQPCEAGDGVLRAEVRLLQMAAWNTEYVELHSSSDLENQARRLAVRRAFVNGYRAYETHAFGYDDLKPVSKTGEDWLGMGVTIVDSLDTMMLMGLRRSSEYARARTWVAEQLDTAPPRDISVFETTIRVLGGLLSAFALSGDSMYRDRAQQLGLNLLVAFDTT